MKVKYFVIDLWGWVCPECEIPNEEDGDPADLSEMTCAGCGKVFQCDEFEKSSDA